MQHHAADQLDVEVALAERALGRLAHGRERRHQQIVELGAVAQMLPERLGPRPQLVVAERLDLGFERVDRLDAGSELAHLALVGGTENLGSDRAEREHQSPREAWFGRDIRPTVNRQPRDRQGAAGNEAAAGNSLEIRAGIDSEPQAEREENAGRESSLGEAPVASRLHSNKER